MSEEKKHRIEVIRLDEIQKHPNADTLGIVNVYGHACAIKLDEFKAGDLAVYIEPDFIAPSTPEYDFLGSSKRIKARKFRGVWSQGLVIKAPPGSKLGQDVMGELGFTRWVPPGEREQAGGSTANKSKKPLWMRLGFWLHLHRYVIAWWHSWKIVKVGLGQSAEIPHESLRDFRVYDLENYRKGSGGRANKHALAPGESVIVTEKIHGTNARYAYREGRMYCGSRNEWKRFGSTKNWYWQALHDNPWIAEYCISNPDAILFGEVYGVQKGFHYDVNPEKKLGFRVFDVYRNGRFDDMASVVEAFPAERLAPVLYHGEHNPDHIEPLSEGPTTIGSHIREGIVIKPAKERSDALLGGRVALKLVSNAYLGRGE